MDLYEIRIALNAGKSIYDLPLRVTYYARVSTDKDEQIHSLSAQVQYYSDFIRKCPNWTYVEGYVDEGISGTSVRKRENFLRMIDDAKDGRFDFIITKEISRFSRNTLDSIQYTQELLKSGVGVLFQSDNINTLMPDAELRLTLMSSIAQDEVRKISERVKFGFKRSIENGTVLGNNRIWGYQKQNGSLAVNEKEEEIVRLIFELYANQRMGIRTIAKFVQILIDLQHDCLSHLVKRLTCTHLKSHRFPEYAQGLGACLEWAHCSVRILCPFLRRPAQVVPCVPGLFYYNRHMGYHQHLLFILGRNRTVPHCRGGRFHGVHFLGSGG